MRNPDRSTGAFITLAKPLAATLFLFNPPEGMTDAEIRRRAYPVLGVAIALIALGFGIIKAAMSLPSDSGFPGSALLPIVFVICGSGYLLVPVSLYRILFGIPQSGAGKFFGGLFCFVLVLVTLVASLIIYGQLSP